MMNLSITIPTYNREQQLRNQLNKLFQQDLSEVKEIIIIDNCSDYDIERLLKPFNSNKIRLIRNQFNTRMQYNLAVPFYYCNTEWLWSLSDDDEIENDSILKITSEIYNSPPEIGMIKFARTNSPQKNYIAYNLENFIDFYYQDKVKRRGDLIFISNNVYNTQKLKNFLGFAFEYAYSYVPQIIPIIKALDEKAISIKFSNKNIVKYLPPREGVYSLATVGKGLSIFSHIPLNLSKEYNRKFLNLMMSINFRLMMGWSLRFGSIKELRIIYNNIYCYYLPFVYKIFIKIFIHLMSCKIAKNLLMSVYRKIKNI